MLTEKGTFDAKSIMQYFANIFYEKRGGFSDLKDEDFNKLNQKTKEYFLKLYNTTLNNLEKLTLT